MPRWDGGGVWGGFSLVKGWQRCPVRCPPRGPQCCWSPARPGDAPGAGPFPSSATAPPARPSAEAQAQLVAEGGVSAPWGVHMGLGPTWGRTQGLGGSVRGCAARPHLRPCWDAATPCLAIAMQKVMFSPKKSVVLVHALGVHPSTLLGTAPHGVGAPNFASPAPLRSGARSLAGSPGLQLVKRQESGSGVS